MLVTSTQDGPAICTHSKAYNTANTTPADTMPTSTNDKVNTPPTLKENRKDTLGLMQRTYPFCKHISQRLLSRKVSSHEVNTFTHIRGVIYKHMMDRNQILLALGIPKSQHFTVLIEAHDKLGHQGVNRTYHLVKHQYYWKGMSKDIHKYINNCALCKGEKARTQVYPLQMTAMPDRPFYKIAIDLVSDLSFSTSENQHILTVIDHLTGWPEAFPILDKKADTTVCVFINNHLPIHTHRIQKLTDGQCSPTTWH